MAINVVNMPVAQAVQDYLQYVRSEVAKIRDSNGDPVTVPNFDILFEAAGKLDDTRDPSLAAHVIHSLLGRAGNIGSDTIEFDGIMPKYTLAFPKDHHLHGSMGNEWYWLGCHVQVVDENNRRGRLSLIDSMQKVRVVDLGTQEKYGWTDVQASACCNIATATVVMEDQESFYCRRSYNSQWSAKGGDVAFSSPADPALYFKVGADTLSGTQDVMPLRLKVDDGDNLQVDIVFSYNDTLTAENAFFLQGEPLGVNGMGNGFTPLERPGIYYSWPQLKVSGSIKVGGHAFTILSGDGWVDHQLLMTSELTKEGTPDPGIFTHSPTNFPYNGWLWQYYNFDNGQAFTGAGFLQGDFPSDGKVKMTYGYFIEPDPKIGWATQYVTGDLIMSDFHDFPSVCNDPGSAKVRLGLRREYVVDNLPVISGVAVPWFTDGTFNNSDGSMAAEFPGDYLIDHGPAGHGYIESIGFEMVDAYTSHALDILRQL